ncbi:hypothetical protein HDU93_000092 [Gonapodya sp. JEL0774]|nr:hypothetical protein HDU93_000092 [Gonapodya sp. JEL0774]
MEVPRANPPLQLSIVAASDSKLVFDIPQWAEPGERAGRNGIIEAQKRHRMGAYLWQAFTAEAMYRAGFGRRTFRLEEDTADGPFNPPVRLLRSRYPLSTIRTPNLAQQRASGALDATGAGFPDSLFDVAMQALEAAGLHVAPSTTPTATAPNWTATLTEALSAHPATSTIAPNRTGISHVPDTISKPLPSAGKPNAPAVNFPTTYHSTLLIDSLHSPPTTILGHTALGGGTGQVRLGVFGSHLLHSYPAVISEVAECAWDARELGGTADDNGECKERWRAWGVGSGATLHEAGHALGLGHSGEGIMARGYNDLARAFAPFARSVPEETWPITAARERGMKWARVDLVRFRGSECFALPTDPVRPPPFVKAQAPTLYPLSGPYTFLASCPSGLLLATFTEAATEAYVHHIEFPFTPLAPTSAVLDIRDVLRSRSPLWESGIGTRPDLTLELVGVGGGSVLIRDIAASHNRAVVRFASPELPARFRSSPVGNGGGEEFSVTWGKERRADNVIVNRAVSEVRVHGGAFVDGFEVVVEEWVEGAGSPQVTVHRLASPVHSHPKVIRLAPGDRVARFRGRAGAWLDGITCVTDSGTESPWAGGLGGGEVEVAPPEGCTVVGIWGTKGEHGWVTSFGIVYESAL